MDKVNSLDRFALLCSSCFGYISPASQRPGVRASFDEMRQVVEERRANGPVLWIVDGKDGKDEEALQLAVRCRGCHVRSDPSSPDGWNLCRQSSVVSLSRLSVVCRLSSVASPERVGCQSPRC